MKIPVSSQNLTPKNLSMSHYTTLGFGQLVPVANYEVCPKSNLTIKPSVFARTDPQKLPNLGSIRLNMHAFYVPFHLVWKHYENFVVGRKSWNSKGAQIYRNCPYTNNVYLTWLFTESRTLTKIVPTADKSDFGYYDGQNGHYFAFTKKGKCAYHILSALGYKFTFINEQSDQTSMFEEIATQNMSLLPLMCFFKAFMDRYIPSYLQSSSTINQFFNYIEEMTANELKQPIDHTRIEYLFECVFTYYESNYFTSAWTNPNSPLDGVVADFLPVTANRVNLEQDNNTQSVNPTQNKNYPVARADEGSTQFDVGSSSVGRIDISATQLSLVKKFNNLVRKLGYSGSRTVEALKSLFGVTPPALEVDFTQYLGSCSTELQKTDVTSTGSPEELGAMAGKSWFSDGGSQTFKVNCDYYGIVLIMANLDTPSNFVRGIRRNLTHIEPLSFYQPDLDGTLLQAIRGSELFSQNFYMNSEICDDIVARGLNHDVAYGFVPRYAEYSTALDNISGDFDIGSLSASITPYILPREVVDLDDIRSAFADGNDDVSLESCMYGLGVSGEPITPLDVINGNDTVQYNRIFKDTSGIADPFFCVFHFDTLANTPTLPLDEAHELYGRGKELEFSQNGHYLS